MKRTRLSAFRKIVGLLLAITGSMLLIPTASGQQEVDPAWYDPWAMPRKVAVPPAPPRTSSSKPQPKNAPQHRPASKVRLNRPSNQQGLASSKQILKLRKNGE